MKFRKPETGEVFDNIDSAREDYCDNNGVTCDHCKISFDRNFLGIPCAQYCTQFPVEAARLMGYEVVEDDAPTLEEAIDKYLGIKQKEANMDKPLKDWTLGELSDYCKKVVDPDGNCFNCEAKKYIGLCPFEETAPCDWDFEVKPRFTEQEVEDAKTIKRIHSAATHLERSPEEGKTLRLIFFDGQSRPINIHMFPSIQPGQSYALDEIIGGAK